MDEKETGLNEREGNSGNGPGCGGKSPIDGRGNYRKFQKMARKSETIAASRYLWGIVRGSINTIN